MVGSGAPNAVAGRESIAAQGTRSGPSGRTARMFCRLAARLQPTSLGLPQDDAVARR